VKGIKSNMKRNTIKIYKHEELNSQQNSIYNTILKGKRGEVPDLFMALMHNPSLAEKTQSLGTELRYETSLDPRLTELSILLIADFLNCPYEWHYHEPEALKAGVKQKDIESIKQKSRPDFVNKEEKTIYSFTNEAIQNRSICDETYNQAVEIFGERGVVELTSLIGYYSMLALILNEHRVPVPQNDENKK